MPRIRISDVKWAVKLHLYQRVMSLLTASDLEEHAHNHKQILLISPIAFNEIRAICSTLICKTYTHTSYVILGQGQGRVIRN